MAKRAYIDQKKGIGGGFWGAAFRSMFSKKDLSSNIPIGKRKIIYQNPNGKKDNAYWAQQLANTGLSSNKLKSMFDDIFSTVATIRYSELRSKIMEKCRINDKSAEKKIKEATEQSIIIKNDSYYFLPGTDNDYDVDDSDDD